MINQNIVGDLYGGGGEGITGCIFCFLVDGPITSRADKRVCGTYKWTFRVS